MEENNEALKMRSRRWWSSHSQDYVEPGHTPHEGVPESISDDALLDYLERVDQSFRADAYFAQDKHSPLFSGLIPMEWIRGRRVLEVGCGLGAHTEMLVRAGAEVYAIDLSWTSVDVTRRRMVLKDLNAVVTEADAECLPFPSESFDYVWSWGVIHHSPNTAACASEIMRVLRPGGRLGIMLYHRNSLYNWINVIVRYGIVRGKLLRMTIQDLHNRYTDGKHRDGAPLSKYYTKESVRSELFPNLCIINQRCFEQKHALSFFVPGRWRRRWEMSIPDRLYTRLWSRFGFLLFTEGTKLSD